MQHNGCFQPIHFMSLLFNSQTVILRRCSPWCDIRARCICRLNHCLIRQLLNDALRQLSAPRVVVEKIGTAWKSSCRSVNNRLSYSQWRRHVRVTPSRTKPNSVEKVVRRACVPHMRNPRDCCGVIPIECNLTAPVTSRVCEVRYLSAVAGLAR